MQQATDSALRHLGRVLHIEAMSGIVLLLAATADRLLPARSHPAQA